MHAGAGGWAAGKAVMSGISMRRIVARGEQGESGMTESRRHTVSSGLGESQAPPGRRRAELKLKPLLINSAHRKHAARWLDWASVHENAHCLWSVNQGSAAWRNLCSHSCKTAVQQRCSVHNSQRAVKLHVWVLLARVDARCASSHTCMWPFVFIVRCKCARVCVFVCVLDVQHLALRWGCLKSFAPASVKRSRWPTENLLSVLEVLVRQPLSRTVKTTRSRLPSHWLCL